jgi:hypothetical protein
MISIKKLYLFFLTALLFLTFSRTFTVLFLTETKTGFLLGSSKIVAAILSALCGIVLLVLAVLAFTCEKKSAFVNKPSFTTAVWSFAVALSLLAGAFVGFNSSLLLLSCLKTIFCLLSAAVFVLYGLWHFNKANFSGWFFAPFVLYLVFETVEIFTNYSTVAVISDHVFDIAVQCLFLLFFLEYAKMQSGIKIKSSRALMALGYTASCAALSFQFSNYICVFSATEEALHSHKAVSLTVTAVAVFIVLTLNDMCKKGSVIIEEQK